MKFLFFLLFLLSLPILSNDSYILRFQDYNLEKIKSYSEYNLKRYININDETLLNLKENGEKLSNVKLVDMRTYFIANLEEEQVEKLNKDKFVVTIYKAPETSLPTAFDLVPITSSFINSQKYLNSYESSRGFNIKYGWNKVGGRGENVQIIDIEGGWDLDHEDFSFDGYLYDTNGKSITGTMSPERVHLNHGTAVIGILGAEKNMYGITGIAFKSRIKVISMLTGIANAILKASINSNRGDIILIEQQASGPRHTSGDYGFVPVEWYDAEFNAIKTVTANHKIVVEAAANGSQNLDDVIYASCEGDLNKGPNRGSDDFNGYPCFLLSTRDSGAIMVGAGESIFSTSPLKAHNYSSNGSRVDVQAWGDHVMTTGYGDRFLPYTGRNKDYRQAYTSIFGGTSSASPIIAGIIAQVQGYYKVKNSNLYISPKSMRDILKNPRFSHAQVGTKHVGPQPDVKLLFEKYVDVYRDTSNLCGHSICSENEECINNSCEAKNNGNGNATCTGPCCSSLTSTQSENLPTLFIYLFIIFMILSIKRKFKKIS